MDLQFRSFYKRDPYDLLVTLISGLHDDLNNAPNRGMVQQSNSYPAFENKGIVELDYIQSAKWDKFFR
jgi:hypothetical protein